MSGNFLVFVVKFKMQGEKQRERETERELTENVGLLFSFSFLSFFQNEGGTAITVLRTSRRLQHQSRRNGNYQWRHAPRRLLVRDESDAIRYIPVYTHLHIAGWFFLFLLLRVVQTEILVGVNGTCRGMRASKYPVLPSQK